MASLFKTSHNFSLYTIPAAWVIAFLPHAIAITQTKLFDLRSPRTFANILEKDQTIDKATKARILRLEGAQSNGFENLGIFAAAVLAGNLAGLPAQTVNTLCAGYLFSRIIYTFIYINNTTVGLANIRSLVYLVGIGQIFTLFIKSGNALRDRATDIL